MPARTSRPAANRRYAATNVYVTEGSAARAARPLEKPRRRVRRVQRLRPRYVVAERTASVSITPAVTFLLVLAVAAALFVGYRYLCLKSSLDTHMNRIKTLESQLDVMRTENDSLEKSIDTSVDLNHVYNVAIHELGMVHVGQDNIVQYNKTESEYVRQYENIPASE